MGLPFLRIHAIIILGSKFSGGKMNDSNSVTLNGELELPAFRLLDPKRMTNPRFRDGVRDGYFNRVSAPRCTECTQYQKGVLAGLALWDICLRAKNHDQKLFDAVFTESPPSQALLNARREIEEFCDPSRSRSKPRNMVRLGSIPEDEQPYLALSTSLWLSPEFVLQQS